MQSSTVETTSSTATPSNPGSNAATGSTGANNFLWILPFTIACAIIYWYLTKRRDLPSEIAVEKSDIPKSKGKGMGTSGGAHGSSATLESDGEPQAPRQPKQTAKKKAKNKKKAVVKPSAQVSPNQANSGGLSKRERKMLAARLTPSGTASSDVPSSPTGSITDSSSDTISNSQPVKAIFEPIRAATSAKPEVGADEPTKVEVKRETPMEVVSKPATKSGVFVPQKRESIVADRNADRWGSVESSSTTFVSQPVHTTRDDSATIADRMVDPPAEEQNTSSQGSSRSGLKNFVSKVRAKASSSAESSPSN